MVLLTPSRNQVFRLPEFSLGRRDRITDRVVSRTWLEREMYQVALMRDELQWWSYALSDRQLRLHFFAEMKDEISAEWVRNDDGTICRFIEPLFLVSKIVHIISFFQITNFVDIVFSIDKFGNLFAKLQLKIISGILFPDKKLNFRKIS